MTYIRSCNALHCGGNLIKLTVSYFIPFMKVFEAGISLIGMWSSVWMESLISAWMFSNVAF